MRFTVIELMIVVAVVSILGAIAIPQVHGYQLRAKRSEVTVMVEDLHSLMVLYEETEGLPAMFYTSSPSAPVGKSARAWEPNAWFDRIGFEPDGEVYGSYWFGSASGALQAGGGCDVDATLPAYSESYQEFPPYGPPYEWLYDSMPPSVF